MENQFKIKTSPLDDNFDGEKILSEYQAMNKEEAIGLLGDEGSNILAEKIKNRTISFEEFDNLCHQAFPKYPERANWIRNIIYNKLSRAECLSMHGVESEKIDMVVKMDEYKDKVQNGTITQEELKELCDITFGKDSLESNLIYEQIKGKVSLEKEINASSHHRH